MYHHYASHHLAMGHAYGGSLGNSLLHGIVSSIGWHVVGSLFRGQSFMGSLAIGAIAFVVVMIIRRMFR